MATTPTEAQDWIVAATIATEIWPKPIHDFDAVAIAKARRAVAEVIRNRATSHKFGANAAAVVLAPKQFSGVCQPYWRDAVSGLWAPSHVVACLDAWRLALADQVHDTAGGATHYYSPISMVPPFSAPSWAAHMTEVLIPGIPIDHFRWYR